MKHYLCGWYIWIFFIADRHPLKQGLKHYYDVVGNIYENIADRHPLKQGLKHPSFASLKNLTAIADRHPLKQGLKHKTAEHMQKRMMIADRHPLKQGLKLYFQCIGGWVLFHRRPTSIKTRIETSMIPSYPLFNKRSQTDIH